MAELPTKKNTAFRFHTYFVHTARRYYRLNGLVRSSDWSGIDHLR